MPAAVGSTTRCRRSRERCLDALGPGCAAAVDVGSGTVVRVSGPVVEIEGMRGAHLLDLVALGHERLVGEVISLRGELAVAQAHEYTGGLAPGAPA